MFENVLAQLAVVATFVQRVITLVKPLYQTTPYQRYIDLALSLVVSALLCVAWQVDAFAAAGIALPFIWLGAALTGVIAGLGSNVLNDLLVLLEMLKNKKSSEAVVAAVVATNVVEASVEAEPKG